MSFLLQVDTIEWLLLLSQLPFGLFSSYRYAINRCSSLEILGVYSTQLSINSCSLFHITIVFISRVCIITPPPRLQMTPQSPSVCLLVKLLVYQPSDKSQKFMPNPVFVLANSLRSISCCFCFCSSVVTRPYFRKLIAGYCFLFVSMECLYLFQ